MATKVYLTTEQQIDILKEKKLLFRSTKKAKSLLEMIGYYKLINAYRTPFIHNLNGTKEFIDGVYFEDLYNLYLFDRNLRTIVFGAVTNVEIRFKAYLSEVISSKYGIMDTEYLKRENFRVDDGSKSDYPYGKLEEYIRKNIDKQIRNRHPSIIWYKDNYGFYPFWVVANILTIGDVSKIYGKMKETDRIAMAKKYQLPYENLASYIIHVNLIRNVCAHNDILYRYKSTNAIPQKVKSVKEIYERLGIKINKANGRYEKGVNDFLATAIVLKLLLSKEDYNLFKTQFIGVMHQMQKKVKPSTFELIIREMGLDSNWKETIDRI